MGCLIVCGASFFLSTILVIVSLALPTWYEETWPDFNSNAFTRANLWRLCFYHPTVSDASYNASGVKEVVNETCGSTFEKYDGTDYFDTHTVIIVLVGCGLGFSCFALILYLSWMFCEPKNTMVEYRVRREGTAAGFFGIIAGGTMLAGNILFMETLDNITETRGDKQIAFWLNLAGAVLQCFVALMTLAFLCISYQEATKSPDVDIMLHSTVPTIQMVDDPGRFSRA
ncbi:hypothetical protein CAPTEDRAFT_221273 [Capitella teleta]|uniref:Claudin n=1 Tax=Capitella teleta TaxID=283909 RepID=R7V025_CAPTE|nr:hypothetical protein CAPTEDRAFT_221273 [Capitella teleta]|eukprot:ELU11909.1 hypothetical protein CAPTEDRAFT_221273 [Capitella teleta]